MSNALKIMLLLWLLGLATKLKKNKLFIQTYDFDTAER